MLYDKERNKIPKKTAQKISKFSYYVDTFFPDLFQMKPNPSDLEKKVIRPTNQLMSKTGNRQLVYNYFYSNCENSAAINENSILNCVKKLYLNQDVIKINQMSYSRQSIFKQSYLPVYGFFSEIIDFVLVTDNQEKNGHQENQNQFEKSRALNKSNLYSTQEMSTLVKENIKTLKTISKPKEYWLYVIHNCNSFKPSSEQVKKISWEHFIERYHFTEKNITDPKTVSTIEYELLFCYKPNLSFLSFQQNLTKLFVESHCKIVIQSRTLQNLVKLQGYLLQRSSEVEANQQKQKDVAFSDEHRRQSKIPIEHFKQYVTLKKQVYQFYINLHNCESEEDINKYFYENLVCRYLIAKEYNFDEAKKGILQYLKWEKDLREKYPSLDSFKEYHALGAYQYIGEDFMGRPVILSKAALIDVNKLPNIQTYCDYYIYYLEIYMRTKMRGYVDQMLVIGDLNNLSSNNFKLAITKRNLSDSLNYGPQRQHGLVIVHASSFAYTAWMFIKPLMPKKTLHKIEITSHDKKQILQSLSSRMDISVIPEYLGGKNRNIDLEFSKPQQEDEIEFVKSRKIVSGMSRVERLSREESVLQIEEVEMVSTQAVVAEQKQSNNSNVIFSFLSSVSKSFGIKLGN